MQQIDQNTQQYFDLLASELSHQYNVAPISNHDIEDVVDGLSLIVVQPLPINEAESIKQFLAPVHERYCASAAATGDWASFDAKKPEDLEVANEYLSMFRDQK